ncbi:MAG: cytotoxic translational repressor of toxin-antitoxin stability system [Oryzomonas sp.]|uniref:type II toxin-antitoxin system RelE family toxin n=1 Tax=Oryzomonas sp. TaxID=2855186 RepID=UPI002850582E|nr:cytotoxic translational repressor of toxin-antitoxin stability system [Oryzomonas sp.]MDR3578663.1 cytotoxic translational repressor of toxin-antitoxin stability system [Oryzomonas sp.]
MTWTVKLSRNAEKQKAKLTKPLRQILYALIGDIEAGGPVRGDWPNYGKLSDVRHHCHLKKGNTTYVAVWEVQDKKIKLVEVQYVGTHEKAPY